MIAENERKHGWKRFAGPAAILIAAAVATVPQLIRGNSCGHDFDFHLVSWLDCVNSWRHGVLYPHWAPSANYGAGEPRFVYYPPLTWMLGAALGLLLPWHVVPIALTFLMLAGTGLATRALALEVFDDAPATLAGCAALFSGYALFTVYERAAFPESAGGIWLPLLLLFVLRDRTPSASLLRRTFDGSTVPLAVALAGCWLSNLPLGVIAVYLLAGVAVLWALVSRSWAPLLRAAVAGVLGFGLSAICWLPAAWERSWVDVRHVMDDPGSRIDDNWLFSHHAGQWFILHDQVLRQVSWIAVSMIAVAILGFIVSLRRGTLPVQKSSGSRRWWIPLAAIPVVVLFLLLPISRQVWLLLPEIRFLQFPWRFLETVEAPMAIFLVAAIWSSSRVGRAVVVGVCSAVFLAMTTLAGTNFFLVCYPEDTVASTLADYRANTGFEGMNEYEPPGADDSSIPTGLPDACLVSDPSSVLGKPDPDDPDANPVWSPDQGSCMATFMASGDRSDAEHRRLHALIAQPGYLVLRLLSFPAWRIRVNGELVNGDRTRDLPTRDDGLIFVHVPQGEVDLTIDWMTTPDVVASRWVSALSVFLLTVVCWLELRYRRPRLR
jgi:hypothetical protein